MSAIRSRISELDHHVSAMCLPRVPHVSAMRPPRAHSLSAQVMCALKPRPRFWTLSALGLLWREPWFPQVKPFLTIAQPIAFILRARRSISLAFILVPQIRPLQAHPVLQKLFRVYAGIMGFFFREKARPRYALAASPELVRPVSASCPP